jgi:hypothetical protein
VNISLNTAAVKRFCGTHYLNELRNLQSRASAVRQARSGVYNNHFPSDVGRLSINKHRQGFENILCIRHVPSGLFSELSVRLHYIVHFLNRHRELPDRLCSKDQFLFFQDKPNSDVAQLLFLQRNDVEVMVRAPIDYQHDKQFYDYKTLPFRDLQQLLVKYFTAIPAVTQRAVALQQSCGLDFKNTIGVIYRGNDKITEIPLASYASFFDKASELRERHPAMRFLVQTDELEFRDEFCSRFPGSVYFQSLPPIPRCPQRTIRPPPENRIGFAIEMLAAIRCLSQTAHLITGSGNVDMWTVLFRGNAENLHQFCADRFLH